ncbi:MAG TPA: sulfotransferase domain-containing protein, partial [Verrucomicrobiae bacterium]|nr:sulfotransferase domain-containing protein [Verrucomicrobiae bacterium]
MGRNPAFETWRSGDFTLPETFKSLDAPSRLATMRKPNFFLVGAPKCGTTAMAQYLAMRPDIFMARKEMHTFGKDLHFGHQFYRRDLQAYLAEFEGWGDQPRAGEASVWYLFSKTAAEEIKAFNPDAQIIIMLRDPVEMLHSMYYTFLWDGNEHLP